jgi:hypothetical protein
VPATHPEAMGEDNQQEEAPEARFDDDNESLDSIELMQIVDELESEPPAVPEPPAAPEPPAVPEPPSVPTPPTTLQLLAASSSSGDGCLRAMEVPQVPQGATKVTFYVDLYQDEQAESGETVCRFVKKLQFTKDLANTLFDVAFEMEALGEIPAPNFIVFKIQGRNEVLKQTYTLKTVGTRNGDTFVAEVRLGGPGGGRKNGTKAQEKKAQVKSELVTVTVMHKGEVVWRRLVHPLMKVNWMMFPNPHYENKHKTVSEVLKVDKSNFSMLKLLVEDEHSPEKVKHPVKEKSAKFGEYILTFGATFHAVLLNEELDKEEEEEEDETDLLRSFFNDGDDKGPDLKLPLFLTVNVLHVADNEGYEDYLTDGSVRSLKTAIFERTRVPPSAQVIMNQQLKRLADDSYLVSDKLIYFNITAPKKQTKARVHVVGTSIRETVFVVEGDRVNDVLGKLQIDHLYPDKLAKKGSDPETGKLKYTLFDPAANLFEDPQVYRYVEVDLYCFQDLSAGGPKGGAIKGHLKEKRQTPKQKQADAFKAFLAAQAGLGWRRNRRKSGSKWSGRGGVPQSPFLSSTCSSSFYFSFSQLGRWRSRSARTSVSAWRRRRRRSSSISPRSSRPRNSSTSTARASASTSR